MALQPLAQESVHPDCFYGGDRLFGTGRTLWEATQAWGERDIVFLARVRENIRVEVVQRLPDGSAIVHVPARDDENKKHCLSGCGNSISMTFAAGRCCPSGARAPVPECFDSLSVPGRERPISPLIPAPLRSSWYGCDTTMPGIDHFLTYRLEDRK